MINISKFIQRTYELEEEQRQKSAAKPKRELPVLQIHLNCVDRNINNSKQTASDADTVADLSVKANTAVQGYATQQQGPQQQQQQQQFTFRNATQPVLPQNPSVIDATACRLETAQLPSSSNATIALAADSVIGMITTIANGVIPKLNNYYDSATKTERQQNGAITTVNWSNIINQEQQYSSSSSFQPALDHHRQQSDMYSQPQDSHKLTNDDQNAHVKNADDDNIYILQKDPSKNQPYTYCRPQQQYEGGKLNSQFQEGNHNCLAEITNYPTNTIIPLGQSSKASFNVSSSTQLEYSAWKPFENMKQQQGITMSDTIQSTVDTMRQKNRQSDYLIGESMKQQDLINSCSNNNITNNNQQNNSLCWKQLSHDNKNNNNNNTNRNICSNCSSSIESTIKEQQNKSIIMNSYQQVISSSASEVAAVNNNNNNTNLGNTRYQTCDEEEENEDGQFHSLDHEQEQEYLPRFSCEGNAGETEQSKTMSSQSLHTFDQQQQQQYQQQYGYILQQERDPSPKSPIQTHLNQESLRNNKNNTAFDHYYYNNNIDSSSAYSQSSQQHSAFPFVNPFSTGIINHNQQYQCIPQSSNGNNMTNSNNSNFAYYNDSPTFSRLSNYQTQMAATGQIQEQQQKKKDSLTISQSNSSLQQSRQKSYEEAFRNVLAMNPISHNEDYQSQFAQDINDVPLFQQHQHRIMNNYGEQLIESYQYKNDNNKIICRSNTSEPQQISGQAVPSRLIDSSAIINYNNYLHTANSSSQQQIMTQEESKGEEEIRENNPNMQVDSLHQQYRYSSELQQLPMNKQTSKGIQSKNHPKNQAYVVSMSIASTADQSTSRLKVDTLTRLFSPEEEQEEIARMQQQQQQDQQYLNSSNFSSRHSASRNTRQQQFSLPAVDTLLIIPKQNTQVLQQQQPARSRERKISLTIQDLVTPNSRLTTPNSMTRKKPQESDDNFKSPGTPQLFRRFRSPSTVEATSRSKKEDLSPSPFKNSTSKVVYSFSRLKTAGTPRNRSLNTTPKSSNNSHIRRNSNLDTQDNNTMVISPEDLLGSSCRRYISPLLSSSSSSSQAKNAKTLWNGNLPQMAKTSRTSSSLNKHVSSASGTTLVQNRKSQERTQENHNPSAFNVSHMIPAERLNTSKHGNIPPPAQKFYKSSAAKPPKIGDDKMKRCIEQLYTSEALGQNSERKQRQSSLSGLSKQPNHNQYSARSSQSSRMQLFKCNHGVMQIYCSQCSRKSRSMLSNQLNGQINQDG